MKSQFVSELVPGNKVNSKFLVHRKEIRERRDGQLYLSFKLGDRTGLIGAVMWDGIGPVKDAVKQDDFVEIVGMVGTFNEKIQITLTKVRKCPEDSADFSDFLPKTERDPHAMFEELKGLLDGISDRFIKKLIGLFVDDPEFCRKFVSAPAAVEVHHAFLGGLVEHTLSVVGALDKLSMVYPNADKDLLLAGGFLHDIGKVTEYEYTRRIDFSDKGRLIGHLVIGYEMVNAKIDEIDDFPDELRLKIGHMILSHHGEYEWRSPVLPMFLEACILHFVDNMDTKIKMFHEAADRQKEISAHWSDFHKYLGRQIYLGEREAGKDQGEDMSW